jgi:hypothetical protein
MRLAMLRAFKKGDIFKIENFTYLCIINFKNMLSVVGTFQNGQLKLDQDYPTQNAVKVIVTFLEEIQSKSEKSLALTDFSFAKSQKNLENFTGSFSETVVEERRDAL